MAVSQIGMIIRMRRKELGLSQEDLADGICAVTTLSRIENGERMPTQNHLEILLQRIGYSDMMLQSYVDESDFLAHELKFKIRQARIAKDRTTAEQLAEQLEALMKKPTNLDRQFMLLHKLLLYPERYTNEERLQELENALRLTHPNYQRGKIPFLLSYEEIILMNNIANTHAMLGNRETAIRLLYQIYDYYGSHMVNMEEILRTAPIILYNLSKYLGLENRYEECIRICDKGILLAQKTGRSQFFATTLFNKAWALLKRNSLGDADEARILLTKSYHVADAFEEKDFAAYCKKFMEGI